jgi:hypothetical protein
VTSLTDLLIATAFTYVETITMYDCVSPVTLIETRTVFYSSSVYPDTLTTTVSLINGTTGVTYTFTDLIVTSFKPGDIMTMVRKNS